MDHLILAANCDGLGSCWIADFDLEILRKTLRLGTDIDVFAFTPLGYATPGALQPPKKRKSLQEITSFL